MTENKDQKYLTKLQSINFQPVFILGLHRSGTSILYKMLTKTNYFNSVTAYHLICYHSLLHNYRTKQETHQKKILTQRLQHHGIKDRGIDRLKITADFAEEYGFHLSNTTTTAKITPKNKEHFNELAQKIQYIANNNKPLLLKNPYDFSNFLYLHHTYPNARFIFIHRNPYNTLSSLMKAFSFLLKDKNYYTTQLSQLYCKVYTNPLLLFLLHLLFVKLPLFGMMLFTLQASHATQYYQKNIKKLPKHYYTSTTYEELCKHPNKTLEKILSILHLTKPQQIDFSKDIKPRTSTLHASIPPLQRFIYTTMKSYFKRFKYPPTLKPTSTKK